MAFQSEVNSNIQALGNAGQIAKGYHSYCNVVDYVAGDNISVGEFAQTSVNENEVKATNGKAITGSIVGVVVRDSLKNINTNTPSTIIPAGDNVAIIDSGNVYIETNEVANVGDFVFLDSTNGNLHFSDRLEVGYTATGWSVFIGNTTGRRGVIGITTDKEISTPPLILKALETNSSVTLNKVGSPTELQLEYRTNTNPTWQNYTLGTQINLANINDWVEMRNRGLQTLNNTSKNYHKFAMTGKIAASGNIQYLLDKTGELLSVSASCYVAMFSGCTSLTTAPELPATTLANSCYANMFEGCTSLTTAPSLPATTLAYSCYSNMFYGCTSLTTAPNLPATTLANYCYTSMFNGCTNLTSAPSLPATTLADSCYASMFKGCTNLKVNQNGSGNKIFTCPSTSGLTNPVEGMFYKTGGSFTGTPTAGNTYNWYN